jgi:hypothetical protein
MNVAVSQDDYRRCICLEITSMITNSIPRSFPAHPRGPCSVLEIRTGFLARQIDPIPARRQAFLSIRLFQPARSGNRLPAMLWDFA